MSDVVEVVSYLTKLHEAVSERIDTPDPIFIDTDEIIKTISLIESLKADRDRLRGALKIYRDKVPLGHQPHMMAHKVDELLATRDTEGEACQECGLPAGTKQGTYCVTCGRVNGEG